MYRTRINRSGRRWFRSLSRPLALSAIFVGLFADVTHAAVTPIGDVLPTDNPFTELVDEGLPLGGNFIDTTEPVNGQTNWENNDVVPGYEDIDAGIVVGQKSFGRLDIDGNSILNYQTLVIGDEGEVGGQTRQGTGFVLITGIGAKYNNDPAILPPGVPANFGSVGDDARPEDGGFNLYVGRAGVGTLHILGGGRAEIQSLTIIGDQPNATGAILVDGFASFLQTGGFAASGGPVDAPQQMAIGRLGTGNMTISNGGTVLSEVAQVGTSNADEAVAAVIGGDVFDTTSEPEAGGRGTVTVTGPTSQWILGGSLQIGGYHNVGTGVMDVPTGEDAVYDSSVGRGTLNVYDNAIVTLRPAIDAEPDEDELRLLIGRFGRVNLDNGTIIVGSPTTQEDDEGRQDNIALINDGVISGGGRIDTGLFRNRFFGEVRVGPGQKLLVDTSAEIADPMQDLAPTINWGLMEIVGTQEQRSEIEFDRSLPNPDEPEPLPFINAAIETQPLLGRGVGQINAAHATLRFRAGLVNQGKIAFIAGDNIVVGPVTNLAGNPDPMDFVPEGEIAVAGNNTTVTFKDHFINGGTFEVFPNASLALFENDLTQLAAGTSAFTIGGRPTGEEVGFVSVLGDIILDGGLNVELFSGSSGVFNPMAGDQYQIMAGTQALIGIFTRQNFPLLPPGLDWVVDYDRIAASVALRIVDSTLIMGADFNGDGVVDGADFAIWFANVGIEMGASPAQGDADGDGDVDGDDFLLWQQQLPPGAGAGAIVGNGQTLPGQVPEPTSLLLLVSGGMLGLAFRRRRAR